jgi:hypothetical protein
MFVKFDRKHARWTFIIIAHEKSPVLSTSCICDGDNFLFDEIIFGGLAPLVYGPVLAFLFRGVDEV